MSRRKALKKKKRQKSGGGAAGQNPSVASNLPGSFVVKGGRVSPGVRQLTADWRRVMSPYASLRLKESRRNKTRDFIAVANPLGATHLQTFTQTEHAAYLKISRLPRGPTCVFQILGFSLIRDVQRLRKGVRFDPRDFTTAPILVLSNGGKAALRSDGVQNVELLVSEMIRSAFAPIDVRTAKLSDCRRVVFFRRVTDGEGFRFLVRQYSVTRKTARLTSGVERVVEAFKRKATQRLLLRDGRLASGEIRDVCDFLLEKETGESKNLSDEDELPAAEVAVAKEALPKKIKANSNLQLLLGSAGPQRGSEGGEGEEEEEMKMAVVLKEIGPRLDLQLVKVEDDVHSGKAHDANPSFLCAVLYHRHVEKSPEELAALKLKEALLKAKREEERQKLLDFMSKRKPPKEAASSGSSRKRAASEEFNEEDGEGGDHADEEDQEVDRPSKRPKFNPFSFRPTKKSRSAVADASRRDKRSLPKDKVKTQHSRKGGSKAEARRKSRSVKGDRVNPQHRKVFQKFARSKAAS